MGESQGIGLGLEEKQSASQVMIKLQSLTTLQRAAPADGNLNYAVKKSSVLSAKTEIRITLSLPFDHLPVTKIRFKPVVKSFYSETQPNLFK